MSHKADNLFIDPSSASMKAILQHICIGNIPTCQQHARNPSRNLRKFTYKTNLVDLDHYVCVYK